jgi:hypothetical protein
LIKAVLKADELEEGEKSVLIERIKRVAKDSVHPGSKENLSLDELDIQSGLPVDQEKKFAIAVKILSSVTDDHEEMGIVMDRFSENIETKKRSIKPSIQWDPEVMDNQSAMTAKEYARKGKIPKNPQTFETVDLGNLEAEDIEEVFRNEIKKLHDDRMFLDDKNAVLFYEGILIQALEFVSNEIEGGRISPERSVEIFFRVFGQIRKEKRKSVEEISWKKFDDLVKCGDKSIQTEDFKHLMKEYKEGSWKPGTVREVEVRSVSSEQQEKWIPRLESVMDHPKFREMLRAYFENRV